MSRLAERMGTLGFLARELLAESRELYDEQADPNETANVADKQSEVAKELSAQLSKGWRSAAP